MAPHEPQPMLHVVEVNEAKVIATNRGRDWWTLFLMAHRDTGRISEVTVSLGGAICHVACDSPEDAQWLATFMITEHGLPRSAVKARALPNRGRIERSAQ
jgi:hypothetical protein